MSIDINEEVKVWGGFSPEEFWFGAASLLLIAVLSVALAVKTAPMAGGVLFFFLGGATVGFLVYQRNLPKGLLWRRFRQEGRFLFLRFPWVHGIDAYLQPSYERDKRFKDALGIDRARH
jgi:hypothetical protein